MYSIVLTDGKIINIKADKVEWFEESRMIRLINGKQIVARINMDNVVGWIDADYKAESEDKGMTRFSNFTDNELDMMEEAFCNEGFKYLVDEIRRERRYREQIRQKGTNE